MNNEIFESLSHLNESAVERWVDETERLTDDDRIILKWALEKGFIPSAFPSYHDMVSALVRTPGAKQVSWKEAEEELNREEKTFADRTDVMSMYVAKVLLPKAEKAYKDQKEGREPEKEDDSETDWIDTEWVVRIEGVTGYTRGSYVDVFKGDTFVVDDVDLIRRIPAAVAFCSGSKNNEYIGEQFVFTMDVWKFYFDKV